jgi:virulence factor Mce-like protein
VRRRAGVWILDNPVFVGAVTVLVVVIAIFLAYNANSGLPFVPTRALEVEFPSGDALFRGDYVRVGGTRVGLIRKLTPRILPDGRVVAVADLRLDRGIGSLPVDSTVTIRPQSALGLKYIDLSIGHSRRTIPDGGTLPVGQVRGETDLDQVYNIFDQQTRTASQTNLKELGDAFAGRGADIAETIQALPRTFGLLTPVMRNLGSPSTRLETFFKQLETTAGTIAPLSSANARLLTTMADTWAAVSRDPQALKDTIAKQPPTLDAGTSSFRTETPFLRDVAAWSRDFDAATAQLRGALPPLNGALRVAVPVTQRSTGALYGNLEGAMAALRDLVQAPTTNAALRGLTATVTTLQPQLRYLGPYVTVCNYWNYWWTLLGEQFSEPDPTGTVGRSLLNSSASEQNGLGVMGASMPANGQGVQPGPPPNVPVYFHGAASPAAITNSGYADCESGQRGYIHGGKLADQFGPSNYYIELDAHTPLGYRHGSTYAKLINGIGVGRGPDHVPSSETFTREPGGIGAKAP